MIKTCQVFTHFCDEPLTKVVGLYLVNFFFGFGFGYVILLRFARLKLLCICKFAESMMDPRKFWS